MLVEGAYDFKPLGYKSLSAEEPGAGKLARPVLKPSSGGGLAT